MEVRREREGARPRAHRPRPQSSSMATRAGPCRTEQQGGTRPKPAGLFLCAAHPVVRRPCPRSRAAASPPPPCPRTHTPEGTQELHQLPPCPGPAAPLSNPGGSPAAVSSSLIPPSSRQPVELVLAEAVGQRGVSQVHLDGEDVGAHAAPSSSRCSTWTWWTKLQLEHDGPGLGRRGAADSAGGPGCLHTGPHRPHPWASLMHLFTAPWAPSEGPGQPGLPSPAQYPGLPLPVQRRELPGVG